MSYLEQRGFTVNAINHDNVDAVKTELGLTKASLKSCHTAVIDGYVIEGHVPSNDIEKLLAERPDVLGLSAPGMPMMSPGMSSLIPKDYDVLAFDKEGNSRVYSSY
ncbi:MAG: CopG family transcriptional regulator [Granulosicoccus sp.]|nr:CopG family transcriptional regulator [Granulosicoccus sp.]